ncbi:hypothetical protein K9L16_00360 [Candidatus Pacearchaeota archaeon]|nr:hypothetical protein [Candidatus Pacearchaeota archaeon]
MEKEIYDKIISKKEFSKLRKKDVEVAFGHFENRDVGVEEKIRLTRDLLRKVFSSFTSQKLLNLKNKEPEWFLKKHISTRERFENYSEIYTSLLEDFLDKKELNIIDLGCGVNGFSFNFLKNIKSNIYYLGIESIGQLVNLQNYYFAKNFSKKNFGATKSKTVPTHRTQKDFVGKTHGLDSKARVLHLSLLELEKIKKIIQQLKGDKIIFLFKVIDSLEMLEKNYSKKLISELFSLKGVNKIVVSFATESLIKRRKFFVKRKWFTDFIEQNFSLEKDFIIGSERYLVLKKKIN